MQKRKTYKNTFSRKYSMLLLLVKKYSTFIFLVILFLFTFFIKFFRPNYFATYGSETAQHYLEIIKLHQGVFLLQGPLTSHPWLRLSATPYYLFYPLFWLFHFHPLTLSFLWTGTSCLVIIINYLFIKKITDAFTAVISSFFCLLSSNILLLDHSSGFFMFIIPLMYLLLWESYQLLHHTSQRIWLIFVLISFMFTLHASAILLLPFFLIFVLSQLKLTFKRMGTIVVAYTFPQLPLLLNDAQQHFSSVRDLFLWIPYKVVNFFSGKTLGVEKTVVTDTSTHNILDFYKLSIFPPYFSWWIGLGIVLLLIVCFVMLLKSKKKDIFEVFLFLLLFYGSLALLIHKNPPHHYFVTIVSLPLILLAIQMKKLMKIKYGNIVILLIIVIFGVINLRFIFSLSYLFDTSRGNTYTQQLQISKTIIADAQGKHFALHRIGWFDNYTNEFKENYDYLMWWLGNPPVSQAPLTYIIVEDKKKMPRGVYKKVSEIKGVIILKKLAD